METSRTSPPGGLGSNRRPAVSSMEMRRRQESRLRRYVNASFAETDSRINWTISWRCRRSWPVEDRTFFLESIMALRRHCFFDFAKNLALSLFSSKSQLSPWPSFTDCWSPRMKAWRPRPTHPLSSTPDCLPSDAPKFDSNVMT